MLYVRKIGESYYDDKEDVNGGLYESNLIKKEVDAVHRLCKIKLKRCKNTLILIGGYLQSIEEKFEIQELIVNGGFDVKIFIATDYVAISTCLELINMCDYLLTQTTRKISEIDKKVKQMYSGVPELFYKYAKKLNKLECVNNKVLFGGADTGRKDLFEKYKLYDGDSYLYKLYIKNQDRLIDTRVPYEKFIDEMYKYKFALIISRDSYRKVGWVTPRYYEAIANYCLPLIDAQYDCNFIYDVPYCLIVYNYDDVEHKVDMFSQKGGFRRHYVQVLRDKAQERVNIFRNVILDIITK